MQKMVTHSVQCLPELREKLIRYARRFPLAAVYDSNSDMALATNYLYRNYDLIAGFSLDADPSTTIRKFEDLAVITEKNSSWYLGYLTYDVKNSIEKLTSSNPDELNWPPVLFFIPDVLFLLKDGILTIYSNRSEINVEDFFAEKTRPLEECYFPDDLNLLPRMKKEEYLRQLLEIKKEIAVGNIYEMNFCQEFYNTVKINPYDYFLAMNSSTNAPFAAFFKCENRFLISASPERFLMKKRSRLVSQPIKGTARRSLIKQEDAFYLDRLKSDPKERAENTMIVDLVRNDLSKIARKNSVKVNELCSVYSFPHVHQMISTISADLLPLSFLEIMMATFPMGSMTGAPKLNAMKYIESFETTKRGLYSGSVGYITPGMDFDFNVIIRSLQYNDANSYVSYMTGGAITAMSDPEKEYEECLLKAYAVNLSRKKISHAQ
jgi:para-aminobenzoate synthetase component 1